MLSKTYSTDTNKRDTIFAIMQTIALPFQQQVALAKEPATNVNDICRRMDDFQITRIDTDVTHQDANEDTDTPTTTSTNDDSHQVYRFKLAPSVQDSVTSFAKVHRYDDRKTYKEAWLEWCDENTNMITNEEQRLMSLGYEGEVIDKMYKAGRYYFRTKKNDKDKKAKKRRAYVNMDSVILDAMDDHIANNIEDDDYTPAGGYDKFVEQNQTVLMDEIKRLLQEENTLNAKDISLKVKKTYKNRYYLYSRSKQE